LRVLWHMHAFIVILGDSMVFRTNADKKVWAQPDSYETSVIRLPQRKCR
jgi:hypothetical protein